MKLLIERKSVPICLQAVSPIPRPLVRDEESLSSRGLPEQYAWRSSSIPFAANSDRAWQIPEPQEGNLPYQLEKADSPR